MGDSNIGYNPGSSSGGGGGGGDGGAPLTDDAVLDLAQGTRTSADRGKFLGTSSTDQDALALLDAPSGSGGGSLETTELYNANFDVTTVVSQLPSFTLPTTGAGSEWLIFNFGVVEGGYDDAEWFWVRTADIGVGESNSVVFHVTSSSGDVGNVSIYRNAAGNIFFISSRGNQQNFTPLKILGVTTTASSALTDDAILDLAKQTRTTADRGKFLGTSSTDENALDLLDAPSGSSGAVAGDAGEGLH